MTLAKAKEELRQAWIKGEGYDNDQMFVVSYKDGRVLASWETNNKLPQVGIIGIEFHGSDAEYSVGTIL